MKKPDNEGISSDGLRQTPSRRPAAASGVGGAVRRGLGEPEEDELDLEPFASPGNGHYTPMLFDIVVAIIIVIIAAILGLVVHPILWVIVIAAVLWLVGRSRVRSRA